MAPKALHALGLASGLAMASATGNATATRLLGLGLGAGLAATLAAAPAQALTYYFGSNNPLPVTFAAAAFNYDARLNRIAANNNPPTTIQDLWILGEPLYLTGAFDIDTATRTLGAFNISARAVAGDAQWRFSFGGAPVPGNLSNNPDTGANWLLSNYNIQFTQAAVIAGGTQLFLRNPSTNAVGASGNNGFEERAVIIQFESNIFDGNAVVPITGIAAKGFCVRYPSAGGAYTNFCDVVNDPYGPGNANGGDDPFTRAVLGVPVLTAGTPRINPITRIREGNFERECFSDGGVDGFAFDTFATLTGDIQSRCALPGPLGARTTDALVRTPTPFSALALAPLAFLRTLRRRYAVLIQEDRQD